MPPADTQPPFGWILAARSTSSLGHKDSAWIPVQRERQDAAIPPEGLQGRGLGALPSHSNAISFEGERFSSRLNIALAISARNVCFYNVIQVQIGVSTLHDCPGVSRKSG